MHFAAAMIAVLDHLKSAGKINNKIALLSVRDQFGAEFAAGFGAGRKGADYEILLAEGYSEIDVIVETSGWVWFIEAKYRSDISMNAKNIPGRDQIFRNLDVGSDYAGARNFS